MQVAHFLLKHGELYKKVPHYCEIVGDFFVGMPLRETRDSERV